MASKLERISALSTETTQHLTDTPETWMRFLDSAAWFYKYSFADQVLIAAQRPDATACAELELWNRVFNRWVNRGAKGIALIDDSGDRPHLRHVFDVKDTNNRYGEPFSLWQANPQDEKRIIEELENAFGDTQSSTLQDAILGVALEAATDNAQDYFDELMALSDHGALAELSAEDARGIFDMQIATAVAYTVLRRIGHDPTQIFTPQNFADVSFFNTYDTISQFGSAVSDISEMVLRQIERTVRAIEQENRTFAIQEQIEQNKAEEAERSQENGTDLYASGRLPSPESGDGRAAGGRDRGIRMDAETLPEGTPEGNLQRDAHEGNADTAPAGDQRAGAGHDGIPHEADGENGRRDGAAQTDEPDGMGRTDEQHLEPRRRDRESGADLQLTEEQPVDSTYEADEAVEEAFPASLFDSPVQEKQFKRDIKKVKQSTPQMSLFDLENVESAERTPAGTLSLRYSQQVVDEALTLGANDRNSRLVIAAYFMKDHTLSENAAFLKDHYGRNGAGFYLDGKQYAVWYDESGFRISAGDTTLGGMTMTMTWEEVAKRVRELLDLGRYMPEFLLTGVNMYERLIRFERSTIWRLRI